MNSPKVGLMPDESMVLSARPHWWYFWKQVAAGVGIVLLLLLVWAIERDWLSTAVWWVTALAFVVWAANTLYEFVQWRSTEFAITTQRVAYQSGFFRRTGVSIPLNRVNNVNFEQGVVARLTNNGTVTIESAGETGDSVFENIPDPEHVRSTIFAQMKAHSEADSHRDAKAFADAMQAETPADEASSAERRLAELDKLRERGLVSEDEFAEKRRQILDEL